MGQMGPPGRANSSEIEEKRLSGNFHRCVYLSESDGFERHYLKVMPPEPENV
jgi:hypothetical protein